MAQPPKRFTLFVMTLIVLVSSSLFDAKKAKKTKVYPPSEATKVLYPPSEGYPAIKDPGVSVSVVRKCPYLPTRFYHLPEFEVPPDGCSNSSILFDNNRCYPLLRPCKDPSFWTTVDPVTLKGRCRRRKCGKERVFVPCDGLCHDIYDRSVCPGGRRLYYNAFGDPVCDCPMGEYPFPGIYDRCVPIFTQGPCPYGQVVTVVENGLACAPAQCPAVKKYDYSYDYVTDYDYDDYDVPLQPVPWKDGKCYILGSRGPCKGFAELLAYDVYERKPVCHNVYDPFSPYFESQTGYDVIDQIYDKPVSLVSYQHNHLYKAVSVSYQHNHLYKRSINETDRQLQTSTGLFGGGTGKNPTTLLVPAHPGFRNTKQTNPVMPNLERSIQERKIPIRAIFASDPPLEGAAGK